MSRRSSSKYHQDHHLNGSGQRRVAASRAAPAGYTLVHAGRQLRLGPIAFWIGVGTLVIMAAWSITSATYFAFREDVLTSLIARHAEMQFGYEDRIADLRAQVDRISTRQLLDQEQYEQKLDEIARRQGILESRASALSAFGDITGAIRPPARGGSGAEQRSAPPKPLPLRDKGAFVPPRARAVAFGRDADVAPQSESKVAGAIAWLQASLDRVEQRQAAVLDTIEQNYDRNARRIHGVLSELGVGFAKIPPSTSAGAVGGPFVPARAPNDAHPFESQLYRITLARRQIHRLTRTLANVPIRKPVDGEADPASGFGVRNDPFTGSPAMHTGLDLQGASGDSVRATADGTVKTAGWSGGYGNAVDIDHGNGFSTRYGHLSSIDVRVGQSVKSGQIIGKVGSTGRSTGPHLHYETRVRGEAVDPQKFLRAGRRLESTL